MGMFNSLAGNIPLAALFILTIIFALTGLHYLITGIYVVASFAKYVQNFVGEDNGSSYYNFGYLLIIMGLFIIIFAVVGSYGELKESFWLLITFVVALCIFAILEACTAGAALTADIAKFKMNGHTCKNDGIYECLALDLSYSFVREYSLSTDSESPTFDVLHQGLQCCGLYGRTDFANSLVMPKSCCESDALTRDVCWFENAYEDGCTNKLVGWLRKTIRTLGIFSLIFFVITLLTVCDAIYVIVVGFNNED